MKHIFQHITAALLLILSVGRVSAQGFTDSHVLFYGEVRQIGGAQTVLLQSGHLEMTFVNQTNAANKVTLETDLAPTGSGQYKPYSYALKVPMAYLPEAPRMDEFLSIGAAATSFKIQEIKINGTPATLPDGSKEFYSLSFASRGGSYQLDLLITGSSTDTDGDGLPDWWEKLYGLDPFLADSGADADNDGWSNLDEFRFGSNPIVSNRIPKLATTSMVVTKSGEAGVSLIVLDSDTPTDGIHLIFTGSDASGFVLKSDGVPVSAGQSVDLTLADLQAGRLTIRHTDRTLSQCTLPVSLNDGGASTLGQIAVKVVSPSTEDATDSTLWLDGMDLTNNGSGVSTWTDRSGFKRNATQPTASYQPVVSANSADFSKSTTAHLFFQDAAISTGSHTVLASYRAAAGTDTTQTVLCTNRGLLQVAPTTTAVSYPGAPTYQMDGLAVRGFEDVTGKTATSIFRKEGTLLQNAYGSSYDGLSTPKVTLDPVLPTLGAKRSALGGANPVSLPFKGQLCEVLVYPTALAEQKLRDVRDYLESKWGGAVIWDISEELKSVTLVASASTQPQIIRGGRGNDRLGGGIGNDIMSGGAGDDILSGGGGSNRFVFGGLDTGTDRIADFDAINDTVDLSAIFWGLTGDARQYISTRLDANFDTEIPTLDSVLIVQRPDIGTQEIVLQNAIITDTQLVQMIVEGRIRMGGLSIPNSVQIALAPGQSTAPMTESIDQAFSIVLTRSGDGVSGELEVPIGFIQNALGGRFVIDEAANNVGQRSVVKFARDQTSLTLTVRPIPDLDTMGTKNFQVSVLPQHKFTVSGAAIQRTISDKPMTWLNVVQANAVSSTSQSARVRVQRDGDLSQSLTVNLQIGGTAVQGTHIGTVPTSVTIPAGQSYTEVAVSPLASGLTRGPKVVLFQLSSRTTYQIGNPNETVLYVAATDAEANGAGFDRWLQKSTNGAMTKLADLQSLPKDKVAQYMQAYAFGLASVDEKQKHHISFRIQNGKPEILTNSPLKAADARWGVEVSDTLGQWTNTSASFSEADDVTGTKLVGPTLDSNAASKFYRLGVNLDPGQLASGTITSLAGSSNIGISGNAAWKTDQATGDLTSAGSVAGETSRIIAKVDATATVDFDMLVAGGGADDLLTFYIDGVKQTQTSDALVTVQQQLTGTTTHLLMWEFKRGTGNAVIRKRAQ